MALGIATRRELDDYATTAGDTALDCRTAGHKWPGFLELATSPFVALKWFAPGGEWRLRRYCERDCKVFKWAHVTRRTLDDQWTIDYSEAPDYLRPTGMSGVSMGADEKRYLRKRISQPGLDILFGMEDKR